MARTTRQQPTTTASGFFKRLLARSHSALYRASQGVIGHHLGKTTVLLLTTRGRKTGKARVTPIAYFRDGSRFIVIASNYGATTDPIWWRNLHDHPDATIQVGSQIIVVRASVATGDEHERLAVLAARYNLTFTRYQAQVTRAIPLIILQPQS